MLPNGHNLAKPDTSQPAENTAISTNCELITGDYVFTMALAAGEIDEAGAAAFFRDHAEGGGA
jgi:hypothetical protein